MKGRKKGRKGSYRALVRKHGVKRAARMWRKRNKGSKRRCKRVCRYVRNRRGGRRRQK